MLFPIQNDVRNRLDLSGIWSFQTDAQEQGEQAGWHQQLPSPRPMAVPGSWNEQYADLFDYLGLSWYLRRTYIPNGWQGQRIFMRVGSANYFARVYVNGVRVGSHEGGHLPFAFEISDQIRWGAENIIAISVENHLKPARVPPGNLRGGEGKFTGVPQTSFDFYPFAGLHRPVILYTVPQVFIEDVVVVTEIDQSDGVVKVAARLNTPVDLPGSLRLAGEGCNGQIAVEFRSGSMEAEIRVANARLWSDGDPYRYWLDIQAGEDHYALYVGIRTIRVEDEKILLNDKPVFLKGFGRHEDFIASGKGLNLPLLVKDYDLMRWTGANSYRTSHYPYSEEEMEMADREGFLIIDEIPAVGLQFENDTIAAERLRMCMQQLEELIARDKNHPSVIMWSVANEPVSDDGRDINSPSGRRGKQFFDALLQRARDLDPTRLVTLVTDTRGPQAWNQGCDVLCLNRYWGWYEKSGEIDEALITLDRELDAYWERWHKPIILTEFGADTIAGMHGNPEAMWTEEFQARLLRGYLEVAAKKDFVCGTHIWNFADFAAVQSIWRVGGLNMKGVFTRTRQPKMAAHMLRDYWKKVN